MAGIGDLVKNYVDNNLKDVEVANNEIEAFGGETGLDYSAPEEVAETDTTEETEVETEATTEETQPVAEETSTEESSLETEETSTEETSTENIEPAFSFDDELAKRTNGKYTSVDDMLDEIAKKGETQQFEYGNELVAKLDELAKKGVNVDRNFILDQMVDYNGFDHSNVDQALELVKRQIRLDDPEITDKEMEWELRDRYKLNEDDYSEEEIERSLAKLGRDARKAKKSLIDNQQANALPPGGIDPEKQRIQEEQAREAKQKVNSLLEGRLTEYEKESIKIGNETFDYKFTDKTRSLLRNDVLNTDKRYMRYIGADGKIDTKQLAIDEAWANPTIRQEMLNAFLKQATSTGSKEVVSDLKNSNLNSKGNPKANRPSGDRIGDAIRKHFGQG